MNKNAIIVWNGPTGSGKTYGAIGDAIELSKILKTNFSVSTNVDFRFDKMLEKMALPQNQKPGTCFVFEELGVTGGGGSSREWQSKVNRFFFSFLQTARHRNQVLMFTTPYFSFIDGGARKLVHIQMTSDKIDFGKKMSFWKPNLLQTNQKTGKIYFKYPRVRRGGGKYKYRRHGVKLLPPDVVFEYEKLKTEFTDMLYKQAREMDKPKVEKGKIDKEVLIAMVSSGISVPKIAMHFKCTPEAVYEMKKRLTNTNILEPKEPFSLRNGRFEPKENLVPTHTT